MTILPIAASLGAKQWTIDRYGVQIGHDEGVLRDGLLDEERDPGNFLLHFLLYHVCGCWIFKATSRFHCLSHPITYIRNERVRPGFSHRLRLGTRWFVSSLALNHVWNDNRRDNTIAPWESETAGGTLSEQVSGLEPTLIFGNWYSYSRQPATECSRAFTRHGWIDGGNESQILRTHDRLPETP